MGIEDGQDQQPSQDDLEQFAQENSPEELEQTEARKDELEAQYEERQLEVAEKAERLQEKIKQKELELEEVVEQLEELETQLTEKQLKTMSKIFNLSEIRALREKIGSETMKADDLQREFDGMWVLYDNLQKESRSRVEINEAEKMVGEFYTDQTEQLEAREQEKRARDVTEVSKKHDAVFTHALLNFKEKGGQFSVIRPGVKWKLMLEAFLARKGVVAAATVRPGFEDSEGKRDEAFFDIGILLRGGEIQDAHGYDSGTVVSGGERASSWAKSGSGDTEKKVKDAIITEKKAGKGEHNEITIRKPEAAGLFITSDIYRVVKDDRFTEGGNRNLVEEVLEQGGKLQMPVYYHDKSYGQYYLVEGVEEEELEVQPDDLKYTNTDIYKSFHSDDCLVTVLERNDFTENISRVKIKRIKRAEQPVSIDQILSGGLDIPDIDKEEMTANILEGEVFRLDLEDRKYFDAHSFGEGLYGNFSDHFQPEDGGYARIDEYTSDKASEPCIDFDSHLKGVLEFVDNAKKYAEGARERNKKGYEIMGKKIGWHLRGLAKAAEAKGDTENYKRALELARTIVEDEEYKTLMESRVDEDGSFKLKKEDLKSENIVSSS